ncbi:hypothetical protein C0046_26555 [Pseudomonas aeruginosa]|nr:hypothetical protein C0046_26555 [Pseudomonas aeruginosa]
MRLLGLFQPIDKILLKVFQALRAKLGFFVNEGLEGYGEVGQKKHKFFGSVRKYDVKVEHQRGM